MKFPKLKNALLCRILTYVVVLGSFGLLVALVACIPFIPDAIRVAIILALTIGLIIYLFSNFTVLMSMDVMLAALHCNNTSRRQFPVSVNSKRIEKRLKLFGKSCVSKGVHPEAHMIRYKLSPSMTVYARGIEKVVCVYHTDILDKDGYDAIARSAKSISNSLSGKKKVLFSDSSQKNAPLNRVTVMIIFAKRVDDRLWSKLYETVSSQDGDGYKISFIPCVIDENRGQCVFNCLREPYFGYAYPVKNRGIRLVRKLVFGGRLPLRGNNSFIPPSKDIDTEQSLWAFWRQMKKELIDDDKAEKKCFEALEHAQILIKDEMLYIKWGARGACVPIDIDEEEHIADVGDLIAWHYSRSNPISKKDRADMKEIIKQHLENEGFTCNFLDEE
jgi:hypothetical protein